MIKIHDYCEYFILMASMVVKGENRESENHFSFSIFVKKGLLTICQPYFLVRGHWPE